MTIPTLLTELTESGVATLILNRPAQHNAFDDALVHELTVALKRLQADSSVRVVVLAAAGKSFCAGADLNWMQRMATYSEEENFHDAMNLAELMYILANLAKPTLAKVQGAAYGGGVGLVACCDIAIASDTASFRLSEVALGLIPAVISPYVVKAVGERQARRYFISAEPFSAAQAEHIGLIHEVVASADLDKRTAQLLRTLLGNGPAAMVAAKTLISTVTHAPIDGVMVQDTARRIAEIRVSPEGREGIAAFLEKRKPAWRQE